MEILLFAFLLFVFLFSVVVHEVAHGFVAERLGDPTARLLGRLTLNPLKHIDPIGSLALPVILWLSGLPLIGWAKPVPFDPSYLKNPKTDAAQIAIAGPISNLVIAAILGMLLRMLPLWQDLVSPMLPSLIFEIVQINVWLAVFNMIPIPPLDGSKVLAAILPDSSGFDYLMNNLEQWGILLIFLIVFVFGTAFLHPITDFFIRLLVGL